MKPITVCLTSCNRFDLLQRTLDSFFSLNQNPELIEKFIITEDSGNLEMKQKILHQYAHKVELIFNEENCGLFKSIDNMYNQVQTEYILHMEDDWETKVSSPFLKESLDVLDERTDIHHIWFRRDVPVDWIENQDLITSTGVKYRMMKENHCGDWNGFTFNMSIKKTKDYKRMFPNGYSEFILQNQKIVFSEHNCMLHSKKFNYRAALLENRVCEHIGNGRTTIG